MAYVYSHTRTDTNEVFYIGIGSDNQGKYVRAYSKKKRSKFWKDVTKNITYNVNILKDNLTWEDACFEEKRLINLYGRRCLNNGTLCNITDGGEGVHGYIHTKERKKLISDNSSGSKNGNAKPCIHFDTSMKFGSLKEGCNYFNLSYKTQTFALKGKYSTAQFYFENEYFERPTKQSISKKLGKLRIGNQNWKGKLKTEKNGNLQR